MFERLIRNDRFHERGGVLHRFPHHQKERTILSALVVVVFLKAGFFALIEIFFFAADLIILGGRSIKITQN